MSVCHVFSRNPLALRDFFAIRTIIVSMYGIFGGHTFLQVWGVVAVVVVVTNSHNSMESQTSVSKRVPREF